MILYIFQCYFFSCVNSCYKVLKKQKYKMISSFLYHESEKFKFMNTNAHNFFILNRCLNLIVIVIIFLIHLFLYQKYQLQFKKNPTFLHLYFSQTEICQLLPELYISYIITYPNISVSESIDFDYRGLLMTFVQSVNIFNYLPQNT